MYIEILIITMILFSLIMAGFGLKLLYNRRKRKMNPACENAKSKNQSFGCACGMGHCDKN